MVRRVGERILSSTQEKSKGEKDARKHLDDLLETCVLVVEGCKLLQQLHFAFANLTRSACKSQQ